MIETQITIRAPPSIVRKAFLNFAALPKYHTSFFRGIHALSKDKSNPFEPGNRIKVALVGISFSPVVVTNSSTEFSWDGIVGSTWIFHGVHSFKFMPADELATSTLFVHSEKFGGILSPLERFTDGSKMTTGFQQYNEDLKRYVEGGAC